MHVGHLVVMGRTGPRRLTAGCQEWCNNHSPYHIAAPIFWEDKEQDKCTEYSFFYQILRGTLSVLS